MQCCWLRRRRPPSPPVRIRVGIISKRPCAPLPDPIVRRVVVLTAPDRVSLPVSTRVRVRCAFPCIPIFSVSSLTARGSSPHHLTWITMILMRTYVPIPSIPSTLHVPTISVPCALPVPKPAPLAYLPSLHPKRFIMLERPVSMRFGYPPAISGLAI